MYPKMILARNFLPVLFLCLASGSALSGSLPDTGQTNCYNTSATTDCVSDTTYPRQDGFDSSALGYTKIDATGNELDSSATGWSCVRDNQTGLIWESKTADQGTRDASYRYAWYLEDKATNGGNEGGGAVPASACGSTLPDGCSTTSYWEMVNSQGLCGATDWRLPTQAELLTLVHAGNQKPSIDTGFFPNTASVPYWSSTTYARIPGHAWGVHFGYGAAHAESKSVPNAVRLVRGTWVK
jgi:hypothetical protein